MNKELLRLVIYEQQEKSIPLGIERHIDRELIECPEILIITGVRRCGKSVLLQQIRSRLPEKDYYLNFDDERLINFRVEDFQTLTEVFLEDFGKQKTFYLDEIQNVAGWERFVSRLYREGNKVFITGSNARLLSRELGTFLTGRHVSWELYPFSFREYLTLKDIHPQRQDFYTTEGRATLSRHLQTYLKTGGFPQYIMSGNDNYLSSLYTDIIYKDVIVRNNINQEQALKEMMYYLASNATHRYTYNSVAKAVGIKSPETVKSYFGFIEDTYLIRQLNKFDYSAGVQTRSPKKIYFIDNAIFLKIGFNATENFGNTLENCVAVELMRRHKDFYYYAEAQECDFVIRQGTTITQAIQVTTSLQNEHTRKRETNGLLAAMTHFQLRQGLIITLDESEEWSTEDGLHIQAIPLWRWLLDYDCSAK